MATNTSGREAFVSEYGVTFRGLLLGFAGMVGLLAVLDQVGVPRQVLGYLLVAVTIGAYAAIGILCRTMQVAEYFAAGRSVPAVFNGMAGAAGALGGTMVLSLAGVVLALGQDGAVLMLGPATGFVIIAVLIAPALRKFGAYTMPDFFALRFGPLAGALGIVVTLASGFALLVAQLHLIGQMADVFLGLSARFGVVVGCAAILVTVILGGLRALTWTQVAQYLVILLGILIPGIALAIAYGGLPVPQLGYGPALGEMQALEPAPGSAASSAGVLGGASFLDANAHFGPISLAAMIAVFALGTASLPHIVMRFFTARSVRDSRIAAGWTLAAFALVVTAVPAIAVLVRLAVLETVAGASANGLPDWFIAASELGLASLHGISIADVDVLARAIIDEVAAGASTLGALAERLDGTAAEIWSTLGAEARAALLGSIVADPSASSQLLWTDTIREASRAVAGDDRVPLAAITLAPEAVLHAAPSVAGLPPMFTGIVVAGVLAAALSTGAALALAIGNSLSHDIYFRLVDRHASTAKRLVVARLFLVLTGGVATWLALTEAASALELAAWAFAIAAAGHFPVLLLGIWWRRCNGPGAAAGMLAGLILSVGCFVVARTAPEVAAAIPGVAPLAPAQADAVGVVSHGFAGTSLSAAPQALGWFGMPLFATALVAVPLGLLIAVIVSVVTRPPGPRIQEFIDDMRRPRGLSYMERERAAERIREFGSGR